MDERLATIFVKPMIFSEVFAVSATGVRGGNRANVSQKVMEFMISKGFGTASEIPGNCLSLEGFCLPYESLVRYGNDVVRLSVYARLRWRGTGGNYLRRRRGPDAIRQLLL